MYPSFRFSDQRGITGEHFFNYGSCYTRLWLSDRRIIAGVHNEHIEIGKFLDENSKSRLRKSLVIQGLCAIDYIEKDNTIEVHEIKKGKNPSLAHKLQLMYYMEIVFELSGYEPAGFLHFPQVRRVKKVERDTELVNRVYFEIKKILGGECPKPEIKPICVGCRFSEMCWS